MTSNYHVVEHYPDGGVWNHWFPTLRTAEDALEDLRSAHKGRTYELLGTVPEVRGSDE